MVNIYPETCIVAFVTADLLSLCVSLQPEEYGQEAMEGQGEAMLDPEGETYDETQQVISPHNTERIQSMSLRGLV